MEIRERYKLTDDEKDVLIQLLVSSVVVDETGVYTAYREDTNILEWESEENSEFLKDFLYKAYHGEFDED